MLLVFYYTRLKKHFLLPYPNLECSSHIHAHLLVFLNGQFKSTLSQRLPFLPLIRIPVCYPSAVTTGTLYLPNRSAIARIQRPRLLAWWPTLCVVCWLAIPLSTVRGVRGGSGLLWIGFLSRCHLSFSSSQCGSAHCILLMSIFTSIAILRSYHTELSQEDGRIRRPRRLLPNWYQLNHNMRSQKPL